MKPVALLLLLVAGCEPAPKSPAGPLIIIVANVSFVSRDDFIADLADARGGPASDEESDDLQFAAFLDDVEDIQREQVTILRDLIAEHGIKAVYLEGVTDANVDLFRSRVKELAEIDATALELALHNTDDFGERAAAMVSLEAYERDILETGAVGQLVMTGEIEVLPLDDEALMDAADPTKNGWRFDGADNDAREAAMVKRLLAGGPVVVVVLGQAHDLRSELVAACPTCRLEVEMPERIDKMNSVGE